MTFVLINQCVLMQQKFWASKIFGFFLYLVVIGSILLGNTATLTTNKKNSRPKICMSESHQSQKKHSKSKQIKQKMILLHYWNKWLAYYQFFAVIWIIFWFFLFYFLYLINIMLRQYICLHLKLFIVISSPYKPICPYVQKI